EAECAIEPSAAQSPRDCNRIMLLRRRSEARRGASYSTGPMARRRLIPAIVVVGFAVAGAAAQQQRPRIPPTGTIKKVRDNLYVIPGVGGNTTVFVTQGGVVLVDTKLPNNGEAILNQVRTVTDKPVSMIINTHSHPDHIGSNEYFPASVEVIAHENTRKWIAPNLRGAPNAAAMPDLAGIPRLRAVQPRAGRRRDRRHGEEDRRADRGGAEAEIPRLHEGPAADRHGVRRHAALGAVINVNVAFQELGKR